MGGFHEEIPYVGLALTEVHAKAVLTRLSNRVFKAFHEEGNDQMQAPLVQALKRKAPEGKPSDPKSRKSRRGAAAAKSKLNKPGSKAAAAAALSTAHEDDDADDDDAETEPLDDPVTEED